MFVDKKIESYLSDRLTFSNSRSRTSRRIYRLALPLRAPETLSSLSKSRISIFNPCTCRIAQRRPVSNGSGAARQAVQFKGVLDHRNESSGQPI